MLWRISAFAALGGFLFGYDLGVMGSALLGISDEMATGDWAEGAIVGAAKLGACFGAFLGGALMLHYGRRIAITVDSVLFMLGPIIMASSTGVTGLVFGRLLVGLGIGVSAVVVPAYLGEVAPAAARGTIVELYEVLLCAGMLAAALVDWLLSSLPGAWRWMLAMPLLPALLMSAALVMLPESPRWLVVNGRLDEALAVIHHILTDTILPDGSQASTAEVEQELLELWSAVEKDKAAARERALLARRTHLARLRHLGLKWRPGLNRKQSWTSLSSIEPAAARLFSGIGVRQFGRSMAAPALRGAAPAKLSPVASLPPPSQSPSRYPDDVGECEMQPLVGGQQLSDHRDQQQVEWQAGANCAEDGCSQPAGSTLPASPAARAQSGPMQRSSPRIEDLPSDRRDWDIPFGRPTFHPGEVTSCEVSPGSDRSPTSVRGGPLAARRSDQSTASQPPSSMAASACGAADPVQAYPASHLDSGSQQEEEDQTSQASGRPDLKSCHSTSLTIRTAPSDSAQQRLDDSPTVWYDDQGTPLFHKSLSEVPAGLTPIRTRSEDFEADLRAAFTVRGGRPEPSPTGSQQADSGEATAYGPQSFWGAFSHMLLDVMAVANGPEKAAFWMAIWLAIFNQACASTAIINYAPQLLEQAGMQQHADSILYSSGVSASKVLGVLGAMLLIDIVGRRPLLLGGSAVTTSAMAVLSIADAMGSATLVLASMCAFIVAFSLSWAGVFWVLMSELFSMTAKSPAVAAATAALFLAGAVTDVLFLALHRWSGPFSFVWFGVVSAAGGIYVFMHVPETKGRKLNEIQALLQALHPEPESKGVGAPTLPVFWRAASAMEDMRI